MANYNRIKAQKASPIGTIMPWTGSSSTSDLASDAIPKGWIVLRGQQLRAKDYPLLAQVVGNLYGPVVDPGQPFVGISNSYPNYNEDDVFNLPRLSEVSLIDLEGSLIDPATQFVVGQYISTNGSEGNQPLTNVLSYIDINFSVQVSSELAGKIKGIDFEEPAYFDTIRTIPRKLGTEHIASHTHSRPTDGFYPSVELGGGYLGLFEAGEFDIQDSEFVTGGDIGMNPSEGQADRFNPGTVRHTKYDATVNSLPDMNTFRNFSEDSDVIPAIPTVNRTVAQYGNTVEYQDDNSCIVNTQEPAVTAPFPPPGIYLGQRNYYSSTDIPGFRRGEGLFDSLTTAPEDYYGVPDTAAGRDADAFASNSLGSHNHFTVDLTMTKGQMDLPGTILINNMTTGNVEPINVDRGLSVQINPNTPSLTVLYIIRAY